jgi:hypothetical protein
LSPNTNSVSDLACRDLVPNRNDLANDFVAHTERSDCKLAPAASDGVNIRAADAAALVYNINIVCFENFGSELQKLSLNLLRQKIKGGEPFAF